jgi:8-oxo-dGTP diphosphatase
MSRHTRYQGAILRDHQLLLIAHRSHADGRIYWLLPGGGIEPGETEEECVRREMREETGVEVRINRLLLAEDSLPGGIYTRLNTYLCEILSGEPRPGYEPEAEASAQYAIHEVRWIDLRDPSGWGPAVTGDRFTYPLLLRIREALGTTDGG